MAITGKEYGRQPAFPSSRIEEEVRAKVAYNPGVSRRDVFAAFALMGYLANPETFGRDEIAYWATLRAEELSDELAKDAQP